MMRPDRDAQDIVAGVLHGIVNGPGPVRGVIIGPVEDLGYASVHLDDADPLHLVLGALAIVREAERVSARDGAAQSPIRARLAVARLALDQAAETHP